MGFPLYQVDAFTSRPFTGNPAAVCLLDQAAEAEWMQRVAMEMNLSETAFVHRDATQFRLRWFTPQTEVDLCGHATLATAHVLWECGRLGPTERAEFQTRSGLLTAERHGGRIRMDFPARPASVTRDPGDLLASLNVKALFIGRSQDDFLVEVATEREVRELRPDFRRLAAVQARGVMVTSRSDDARFDFVSRFFAPASGVDEDPVTGSAHCTLGPYWSEKLQRDSLVGFQASARGGTVSVRMVNDRVWLEGQAVTVLRGELL